MYAMESVIMRRGKRVRYSTRPTYAKCDGPANGHSFKSDRSIEGELSTRNVYSKKKFSFRT